ncbi:MAG: polysaccharide export outer membrane protein [bacterium P3]|nr:MAG: polysaccharide export outer membrane protein [bacterium P3]KWW40363.1 MAG: polysaccharide export outer membrane protein [bacterium F083]
MMLLAAGCATPEIAYIHDAPRDSAAVLTGQFSKGIQPNDLLHIYVESATPESAIQFNQETNRQVRTSGVSSSGMSRTGYLVNQDGDIVFPILGRLHVGGMTHRELSTMLEQRLIAEGYITDPVVTVRLQNFKVSILGDVKSPKTLNIDGERVTIFEALSMAGDLTIYGQRKNVTVVREENGVRTIGTLDLTSKEIFDSPYYYLHQNDMVYVEPNNRRKRDSTRDPIVFSLVSTILSAASLAVSIYYYTYLRARK